MSVLTFDDLIAKQYLVKYPVTLPGVGQVELNQISALEAKAIIDEAQTLDGDNLENFICAKAVKFIKGEEPTEAEVLRFRECHTSKTISLLYTKGLNSAVPPLESLEEAEKN